MVGVHSGVLSLCHETHLQVLSCRLVIHDVRGAAHVHACGVRDLLAGGPLVDADAGHANGPWRIACLAASIQVSNTNDKTPELECESNLATRIDTARSGSKSGKFHHTTLVWLKIEA